MISTLTFVDRPVLFVAAAIISSPLYVWIGTVLFDDWAHFLDSLRLWYQPWWLSALRGEWDADYWESLRLLLYVVSCLATATAVYKLGKLFF